MRVLIPRTAIDSRSFWCHFDLALTAFGFLYQRMRHRSLLFHKWKLLIML